jgi:histidinol phosphatase-like PHP family hydrolase
LHFISSYDTIRKKEEGFIMRYIIDHDIHIHSQVSPCSRDARQTKEAILAYGITNQYRLVGVTDHLWPDTREHLWPSLQNLPQADSCRFLAGTEVDMDMHGNLLISPQEMEKVDYFILALTHLHLLGCVTDPLKAPLSVEDTAVYLKERLYRAFAMDLPFERMGLAHITHIPQPKGHDITECLALFDDNEWKDIFENIARRGMGVELNFNPFALNDKQLEAVLHPYRIAKEVGCKFYLGGDAHHPETFGENLKKFNKIIE